jgi:hypothetical protein
METNYTQCEKCGLPIQVKTHGRNNGLCRGCYSRPQRNEARIAELESQRIDPVESDPRYLSVVNAVDEAAEIAARRDLGMSDDEIIHVGFCHVFWRHRKQILSERYQIEWKSPAEMNPNTWYD